METRQVALIRGINVGRAKRVAMADLRAMMERLGYADCRTLLNSGNVVFTAGRDNPSRSVDRIEQAMSKELGVEAPVIVLDAGDFSSVVDENPLIEIATDPSRLMVAFLMRPDDLKRLEPLAHEDWGLEALALGRNQAAYLWCPEGVIKSRLTEAVAGALDKVVTARNWNTVLKIAAVLGG